MCRIGTLPDRSKASGRTAISSLGQRRALSGELEHHRKGELELLLRGLFLRFGECLFEIEQLGAKTLVVPAMLRRRRFGEPPLDDLAEFVRIATG